MVLKDRAPLEELLGAEAPENEPEGGANGLQESPGPLREGAASEGAGGPPGRAESRGEGSTGTPEGPLAGTEGDRDDPGEEDRHV